MGQDAGPHGPAGPTGQDSLVRPIKACFREELDREAAAGLINRCELLSTSEVGLNFGHGKHRPLVPGGVTNRD
jgi:hypothetical protein